MKKTVAEFEEQGLKWVKGRGGKPRYELQTEDGEVLGTLTRSYWTSRAEVDAFGNRWTFERKGFFRQRVVIRSVGTGEEAAEFIYEITKGKLVYPDGRVFLWKQGDFWGTKWVWLTEEGEPLIGFQTHGILNIKGEISYNADLANDKAPSLLIFLGWYLYMLYQDDAAAATVTV